MSLSFCAAGVGDGGDVGGLRGVADARTVGIQPHVGQWSASDDLLSDWI